MKRTILISGIIIASFSCFPITVRGQSLEYDYQATTIADLEIPEKELELTVKPLTQEKLEVEASAWLELLEAQVREVSNAEIAVNRENEELAQTQKAVTDLQIVDEELIAIEEKIQKNPNSTITEEIKKDIIQAQEDIEKAQEDIKLAIEEERKTQENEALKQALTEAKEDAAAELAKPEDQILEETIAETTEDIAEIELKNLDNFQKIDQAKLKIEATITKLETTIEDKAEIKTQLLHNLTKAREEQTAMGDRFEVIINELEKKGGDAKNYRQYLSAVGLIKVDISDRQALWITVLGWLKSETGGIRWALNISKFVSIAILSVVGSFSAAKITRRSLSIIPNMSELLRGFLVGIVRQGTLVIGVLFALTALGISLGPLLAVFGGVSFVLAFALQNNLGNLASGLMIMFYKPFDEGDEIKVDDLWGYVDSITIASTKIKGWSGEIISVPNDSIWNSNIINLTYSESRGFMGTVVVDIAQNLSQAKQVILEAIKSHPAVLAEPEPRTLIWELDGDSITILFFGHTKTKGYWQVYEEVIELIQQAINNAGIALDIPEQIIQIESVDKIKVNEVSNILATESLKKIG
ncbi:MAG: mechanosensitive ion channel domain-containing protein [Xenococcus sp. (in: cyanobacteria)]